eukprot:359482-Prymnesium_polylepis.1
MHASPPDYHVGSWWLGLHKYVICVANAVRSRAFFALVTIRLGGYPGRRCCRCTLASAMLMGLLSHPRMRWHVPQTHMSQVEGKERP